MRFGKLAVVMLFAALLVPATAMGQYSAQKALENPDYYVTAYYNLNFGGGVYKDLNGWSGKSVSHGLGASITVLARHLVSAEIDFNYSHSFFGSSDQLSRNYLLTTTLDGIVGPWFKLGSGRVRPYLAAGGGYARGLVTNRRKMGWADTGKNLLLAEGGAGMLWLFNDSIGLRADVRYRQGFGAKENGNDYGRFGKFNYLKSTLGLSIAF
jgi:hypothetical protein